MLEHLREACAEARRSIFYQQLLRAAQAVKRDHVQTRKLCEILDRNIVVRACCLPFTDDKTSGWLP